MRAPSPSSAQPSAAYNWSRKKRRVIKRTKAEVLQEFFQVVAIESLFPDEATALLLGRLETVKRTIAAIRCRLAVAELDLLPAVPPLAAPPRPNARLSALNRSRLFPPLLNPAPHTDVVNVTQALRDAARRAECESRYQLLDFLVSASGVSLETAAALLWDQGALERPFHLDEIEVVSRTRLFRKMFDEGRLRYRALVQLGSVPGWVGTWGHFDWPTLANLLPGIRPPDHCERRQFLARYWAQGEEPASLDLHTMPGGRPLCRHEFEPRHNPLRDSRAVRLKP